MKSILSASLIGLCLVGSTGCASDHAPAYQATGDPVVDSQMEIQRTPQRDRVLVEYRAGLTYLRKGQFNEAKRMFDNALALLGGNKSADPNSRKARSYFHSESKKTFIGEPYERVMAYYYRGILYWMDGEPDNARACFRSAQIEDGDSEDKTYAADYLLLDYLDGFATAKLAGDGSDAFNRAKKLDKTGVLPPYDTKANVLFFVDYGQGPQKYATGDYHEELRFREGYSVARRAIITVDNQAVSAPPYDDLFFQATTRGGRVMDHILGHKAVFKEASGVVGVGSLFSGAVLMGNRDTRAAGAGLAAFGLLATIASAATTPSADTRMWESLPQYLSFAAVRVAPGQHTAKVEFQDAYGTILPGMTKTVTLNIPAGARDSVIYINDQTTSY